MEVGHNGSVGSDQDRMRMETGSLIARSDLGIGRNVGMPMGGIDPVGGNGPMYALSPGLASSLRGAPLTSAGAPPEIGVRLLRAPNDSFGTPPSPPPQLRPSQSPLPSPLTSPPPPTTPTTPLATPTALDTPDTTETPTPTEPTPTPTAPTPMPLPPTPTTTSPTTPATPSLPPPPQSPLRRPRLRRPCKFM